MPIGKLSADGAWAVDGEPIYCPTDVDFNHEGLQSKDSGRMEDGYMYKEWVRTDVRKVNLTYEALTGAEKDRLRELMQGRDFEFTYFDNGIQVISSAYCNKMTYKGYRRHQCESEGGVYTSVKINIIEN